MTPTVAELLAALPQEQPSSPAQPADERLKELFEQLALRPVPVGSIQRLWTLGGLQAKLAMAYFVYYIRTWFHSSDQNQQNLLETNLRSALRTMEAMGYLRGAVMKVGQALAMFPQLVPDGFAELLATLHFEAPPMHFSLVVFLATADPKSTVRSRLREPSSMFSDTKISTSTIRRSTSPRLSRSRASPPSQVLFDRFQPRRSEQP